MNFKHLLLASTLTLSAPAFSAGFTPSLQILGIDVGNTGALIIRLGANTECGTPFVIVLNNESYYKDMLAMTSLAYATSQPVRVWVNSCNASNQANVVRMVLGSVW